MIPSFGCPKGRLFLFENPFKRERKYLRKIVHLIVETLPKILILWYNIQVAVSARRNVPCLESGGYYGSGY